jgi:hypothetical protein
MPIRPHLTTLAAILTLLSLSSGHFVLQSPTSLGFDDENESVAPCGSFNPTDRSTGVTDWPVGGSAVNVLTTHTSTTWEFNAALVSDPGVWVPLTPSLKQTGVGTFCEPGIPGVAAWVGRDAVLQVLARGPDGVLYQVCGLYPSA